MEKQSVKYKTITGFLWRFAERCGAQGVSFIVSIVLARLLSPDVYGSIALVTVFTSILQVFVDSGMGNALVQKKNADDIDFSTVFFFNVIMCSSLYVLLFFAAPYIAKFYNDMSLAPVVRVLGLTLVISGLKNIQQSYISKNFLFKKFFFATLAGTIGSACVGIFMAYKGYGIWALVIQQMFSVTIDTLVLWITVKWRPKLVFSFKRLKSLFSFGSKLLLSSILNTVYNDIRQLIIGKLYSTADLSFYNKGKQFPSLLTTNINSSIDSVLLPTMANEQDNKERVKGIVRRSIKTSTYIMAPVMIGLACVAEPFIRLMLTEKWIACVPFLRIFCISYMFYPIHTANLNAIKAIGRSDLFFKLEVVKKAVGIALLLATMTISVKAMAYSLLLGTFASQIINTWPNKKLLGYSFLEQNKDMAENLILAVIMGAVVLLVPLLKLGDFMTLLIQVVLGVAIYIGGSVISKNETFFYMLNTIKSKKRR